MGLSEAFCACGFESLVCTTKGRKTSGGTGRGRVVAFRRMGPERIFFASGMAAYASELASSEGMIFHGHGFYVYPNLVFGRAARRYGVPLVYHVHGIFEPWILRRSRLKKRVAHFLFEDENMAYAKLWRALTYREADQIRACGVRSPIIVLPNGIDLRRFGPASQSSIKEGRILFLGRLHPKKGLDLLIGAFGRVVKRAKHWRLIIAGPDEDGYVQILRRLVMTAGLESYVELVGPVVGDVKLELLRSADVFALTSYSEGLPMAVLEAMAVGCPVLLTSECNVPEAATSGAGWECTPTVEDVESVLYNIVHAGWDERRQRGAIARRVAEDRFDWIPIAEALNAACRELVF
jgi:poly(glycerol-phosphate) alpha-glucosyltransferase